MPCHYKLYLPRIHLIKIHKYLDDIGNLEENNDNNDNLLADPTMFS